MLRICSTRAGARCGRAGAGIIIGAHESVLVAGVEQLAGRPIADSCRCFVCRMEVGGLGGTGCCSASRSALQGTEWQHACRCHHAHGPCGPLRSRDACLARALRTLGWIRPSRPKCSLTNADFESPRVLMHASSHISCLIFTVLYRPTGSTAAATLIGHPCHVGTTVGCGAV